MDKVQKALDESQQAFDKTQSEIKSLNDELEKLEAQSEELERQLALKREEDKINTREHAKNSKNEYNILVDSEYLYDYESDSSVARQLVLPPEELNEAIRRYGIYATEKERIDQELINAENKLVEAQAEKKIRIQFLRQLKNCKSDHLSTRPPWIRPKPEQKKWPICQ